MKGFSDEGERLSHHLCIFILITGGGGSPRREGEGESDSFHAPFVEVFVSCRSRFLNYLSAQGLF